MFGIFKKKQSTVMDGVIRAIYGDNPPAKSADLERAITIAHEDLLAERVPLSEVKRVAGALAAGPMPYSTYDLAVAAALSFFKDPTLRADFEEVQIAAACLELDGRRQGSPGCAQDF